ncbi:kinase-like domain-containing protein [Elsinoe ampelina]|uniref:Kinase-like domain-containing protein n=1 Tax=Elsinoe ampelina TaxID=302913 RepID=A0A6A6G203_9PEZI|nr:kinase-like domain-containing protein [Elsinoe ampelina]
MSSSDIRKQEDGCFAITAERKYYHKDNTFIKRSLRPHEYITGQSGLHTPRLGIQSLKNEAACLQLVQTETDVPVPRVLCDFEDDNAYYLITEYIEGVGMNELTEDQKAVVKQELLTHIDSLHKLKSARLGGPSGLVIPPYRIRLATEQDKWRLKETDSEQYVFCHNDLSQHNVIVDPDTLKINAIVDWEYAGFYPAYFEMAVYERPGPSAAFLEGETDNRQELLDFLRSQEVKS